MKMNKEDFNKLNQLDRIECLLNKNKHKKELFNDYFKIEPTRRNKK